MISPSCVLGGPKLRLLRRWPCAQLHLLHVTFSRRRFSHSIEDAVRANRRGVYIINRPLISILMNDRSAPAAASTRLKSTLPNRPSLPASLTASPQNHTNDRQHHPLSRRRSPRNHQLGRLHAPQTRAKARSHLPRRPLLHPPIRFERKDTACSEEDIRIGSQDDQI